MDPTPRLLARGALSAVLATLAVVFDSPIVLVGAAAVGAWVVGRQVAFTSALSRTTEELSLVRELDRTTVRTDADVSVTLTATLEEPRNLSLALEDCVSNVAVDGDGRWSGSSMRSPSLSLTLQPGETTASGSTNVSWPVSGRHELDPVAVTATDGYLRETVRIGESPTVTVEPREAEEIHVGTAGDQVAAAYGDHDGGRLGSGESPAEPREYVPGDTADRIDWKASARLATTYVREYETETDHWTVLVVDHRSTLADGPPAGRKFDHLREVALTVAETARRQNDPVVLVTVDDEGISGHLEGTTGGGRYRTVAQRLRELEPSDGGRSRASARGNGTPTRTEARHRLAELEEESHSSVRQHPNARQHAGARQHATARRQTDGDRRDRFAATVRPFYEERATGTERTGVETLTDGVRAAVNQHQRRRLTAIFTDDSRPRELHESVALARSRGNDVLLFLAPSVLYESHAETGLEGAFDRYVDFEEFRRTLARMDGVVALEVGPADRLSAALAGGLRGERR